MKLKNILFILIIGGFLTSCDEDLGRQTSDPSLDSLSNELSDFNGSSDESGGETVNSDKIVENPFIKVDDEAISTFSIDADGAAYSNMRRYLDGGSLPDPNIIRTEELINYFNYDYPEAEGQTPISLSGEISDCPWNDEHKLMRVGIKGKEIAPQNYPNSNIVFLIDVSGSMNSSERLPMLKTGFKKFVDQIRDNDRIAIATYSGSSRLALESTSGKDKDKIKRAIDELGAGGSTNGEGGIIKAYEVAQENFIEGGNNRVIVATDGYFNVGISDQEELVKLIEEKRDLGIFLTIIGVGTNYNEGTLEQIANNGNGNFEFLDNEDQVDKVFIDEYNKFFTVAKDVKVQVEFNSDLVKEYRLIGYENRLLSTEEFLDDTKDAGEIGADQSITALYELIPSPNADRNYPAFNIDFRYKLPDSDSSEGLELDIYDLDRPFKSASSDHRFAASVASFGLLLRDSEYKGSTDFDKIKNWARDAKQFDPYGYKSEFIDLVEKAKSF